MGTTGLEPATSGVTGRFGEPDDWRRWTCNRSIHAGFPVFAIRFRVVERSQFRTFAARLLPGARPPSASRAAVPLRLETSSAVPKATSSLPLKGRAETRVSAGQADHEKPGNRTYPTPRLDRVWTAVPAGVPSLCCLG
jgi:hypothetical protein